MDESVVFLTSCVNVNGMPWYETPWTLTDCWILNLTLIKHCCIYDNLNCSLSRYYRANSFLMLLNLLRLSYLHDAMWNVAWTELFACWICCLYYNSYLMNRIMELCHGSCICRTLYCFIVWLHANKECATMILVSFFAIQKLSLADIV